MEQPLSNAAYWGVDSSYLLRIMLKKNVICKHVDVLDMSLLMIPQPISMNKYNLIHRTGIEF